MNKKKTLIFLIILVFASALFGIRYYQNKRNLVEEQNLDKEQKSFANEEANVKDDEAYGEELVTSLSVMFKNMVNNKNADLSYLRDVINSESDAYSIIEGKIKEYREKDITIEYLDYYINKVEKIDDNDFKVNITSNESININGENQKNKKTIEIKLKLVDDKGIYEYKEM